MSKKHRMCGYCKKKLMAPCDNPQQAKSCGFKRRKALAYRLANTPFHPLRGACTLEVMLYHQHKDEQMLDAALKDIFFTYEMEHNEHLDDTLRADQPWERLRPLRDTSDQRNRKEGIAEDGKLLL